MPSPPRPVGFVALSAGSFSFRQPDDEKFCIEEGIIDP